MFPFDWELIRIAGAEPIPHHLKRWWFALGGTVMYLFVIQVVTGIALTFYYVPTPEAAYESVANITGGVRFGWFIRSLHHWGSNFMIVAVFLHMLRVYFTGAYRHPRQLNWMIGVLLLVLTLVFGFTGYSLVYEQLSFWGATVAANLTDAIPLVGPAMAYFLRGGIEVGPNTLTRFFILHIGVLPTVAFMLIGLHVLLIRLHGVAEHDGGAEDLPQEKRYFKFWPDHATTELAVGFVLMYLLTIMALIWPAGLGEPADPTHTPAHIKPEWYFYFNYRLLKLVSLKLSVVATVLAGLCLFIWPFIDELLIKRWRLPEKLPVFIGVLTFLGFLALTVWESLS
jgi:ubiquinol-cytochrome c reductase cytochrome b subunit/cytochrome b6